MACSLRPSPRRGSVDGDATNAGRKLKRIAGRIAVEALREAAWMLFFAPEVREHARPAWSVELPADLAPAYGGTYSRTTSYGAGSGRGSSEDARLRWSWQTAEGLRASGEATWPDGNSAGDRHAVRLLRAAEQGLVASCPPAPLPAKLLEVPPSELLRALAQPVAECAAKKP